MKLIKSVSIILTFFMLAGCAATQVALEKRNLDVQTKMSESVFLDPVSSSKKTIYLQFRNTSDKQNINIKNEIVQNIANAGYRVESNPDRAYYILQVNLLQAGKTDPAAAQRTLASGFGGALGGLMVAGATGSSSSKGLASAGLIGAGIEIVANSLVKDVTYSLVTDIKITERKTKKESYKTRVVSTANQVNLDFPTAIPDLQKGLVMAISGLFV